MNTLSICIPTINRQAYLLQALRSIIETTQYLDRLEICISNNCSDEDYSEVEEYVNCHPSIKYVRHAQRIPLDENMHSCVKRAVGIYVYYLGDDDYFLPGGLDEVFHIIDRNNPDVVMMNGLRVDPEGVPFGRLFLSEERIVTHFPEAFEYYSEKSVYGAILVKREYLKESLFEAFYNTSHAYTCYWATLAMLSEKDKDLRLNILTPANPIVALREAKKTYSGYALDVHYAHMPRWYEVFLAFIEDGSLKRTMAAFIDKQIRRGPNMRLRFIAGVKLSGSDVRKIRSYPTYRRSVSGAIKLRLIELTPLSFLRFAQNLAGKMNRLRC
jgi:glycosyltransferase involved in cell wall biosynthesis